MGQDEAKCRRTLCEASSPRGGLLVSEFYSPENERGIRWNDPTFNIEWPIASREVSDKDARWPDFELAFHGVERLRDLQ